MLCKSLGTRSKLIFCLAMVIMTGLTVWAVRHLGRWLVAPDPLHRACAVVILSGRLPFRAMEAAKIYHDGWAPEVWLFQDERDEADAAFAKMGISYPTEHEYNQQILERLGVPQGAIRVLEPATTNTVSELQRVAEALHQRGGGTVILVTSPVHTRRAKLIWRIRVGDHPRAIICADEFEPSDLAHWWRSTQDIQDVEHEVLGLIDVSLGFPVKPRGE